MLCSERTVLSSSTSCCCCCCCCCWRPLPCCWRASTGWAWCRRPPCQLNHPEIKRIKLFYLEMSTLGTPKSCSVLYYENWHIITKTELNVVKYWKVSNTFELLLVICLDESKASLTLMNFVTRLISVSIRNISRLEWKINQSNLLYNLLLKIKVIQRV